MTWSWKRNIDGEAVAVDSVVICNRVMEVANGDVVRSIAFGATPADCGDVDDDSHNDDYDTTTTTTNNTSTTTSSSSSLSSFHKGVSNGLRERNRALTAAVAALILLVVSSYGYTSLPLFLCVIPSYILS